MTGRTWEKNGLSLKIPFSVPGVSTVMLLSHDEQHTIIDCGDGAARYLHSLFGNGKSGYDRVADIMLTHEHLDHSGGIPSLLMLFEVAGRSEPLTIATPCGEKGMVHRFASQLMDRLHFEISFRNLLEEPHRAMHSGGADITAFETRHRDSFPAARCGDPVPSNGYSFNYRGMKIVFSGDTGPTGTLENACSGADLAVLESTWERPVDCGGLHLTVSEAIRTGSTARETILMHPLRNASGRKID